jgi:hypothetical protein
MRLKIFLLNLTIIRISFVIPEHYNSWKKQVYIINNSKHLQFKICQLGSNPPISQPRLHIWEKRCYICLSMCSLFHLTGYSVPCIFVSMQFTYWIHAQEWYCTSIFRFLRNHHTDCGSGSTNINSHRQFIRVPSSPHLHWLLLLVFLTIFILTGVRWNFCVIFICISFFSKDVEYFFTYLLAICNSSFENYLFILFAHLLIEFLSIWYLIFGDVMPFVNICSNFLGNWCPIQKRITFVYTFKGLPYVFLK